MFDGFVKDFVREHIYPGIRDHVPSSTKQGSEALFRRLRANKELYRLEENDYGEIESVLAEYISGETDLSEVLRTVWLRASGQRQQVTSDQVGSVEEEFPGIVDVETSASSLNEFDPMPPIMRLDIASDKKVLSVAAEHARLNNFQMFLALSDRLVKREGEFLHWPHTTRMMWGAHRIIYIFTAETGEMSLYYDIELRTPLEANETGSNSFVTTTIVTKNRIYVPVPKMLREAFGATESSKEFYVNFNTIP